MEFIKFNLNYKIKVKLNKKGIEILKNEGSKCSPDENGYVTFQGWELINIFGGHLQLGLETPFDLNVLIEVGEKQ